MFLNLVLQTELTLICQCLGQKTIILIIKLRIRIIQMNMKKKLTQITNTTDEKIIIFNYIIFKLKFHFIFYCMKLYLTII